MYRKAQDPDTYFFQRTSSSCFFVEHIQGRLRGGKREKRKQTTHQTFCQEAS